MLQNLRRSLGPWILVFALSACSGAFGRFMEKGDQAAAAGNWDEAAQAYLEAARLDPEDEEAAAKLHRAKQEQAKGRIAKGRELLAAGRASDALQPFFEASQLDPANPGGKQGFTEARGVVLKQARAALEAGKLKEGYKLARAVLLFEPTDTEARELEATAKVRIADAAAARGQAEETKGQLTLALVDYGEALAFKPDHATAGPRAEELKKTLRAQVTFWVALSNFDGDKSSDDLGNDVNADVLSQGLDASLPLRIVGTTPQGPKDKSFKLAGMRLGGEFRNYRYDKKSSRSSRSCDYVCGKELVPNPEYATAEAEMRAAQSALGAAEGRAQAAKAAVPNFERARDAARSNVDARRQDLARAEQELSNCKSASGGQPGTCATEEQRRDRAREDSDRADQTFHQAESDVSSARSELSSAESDLSSKRSDADFKKRRFETTPAKVEIDKHCTHTYSVDTVTVSGEVECQLHGEGLYDTNAVLTQSVAGKFSKQDDSFPPQAGVCAEVASGDPLTLPSQPEVKKKVVFSAVAATQREILAAFERYRMGYSTRAKEAQADRRADDAADLYVRWVFTLSAAERGGDIDIVKRTIAELHGVEVEGVDVALKQ
jgi:tetratricopeptide (TPR) repeat protein